ncbi:hypothetical protein [Bacillus sp. V5-8f]|nr:hypothetical protein [Bacillus sp. V5-8f]
MQVKKEVATIKAEAIFDETHQYRYSLKRIWDENKPKVTFIL